MKIIGHIISGMLTILGAFAVTMGRHLPKYSNIPLKPVVLGLVMISWGMLLTYYIAKSYRGGTASIIGAILLGVGIWSGLGELFWQTHTTSKEAWTAILVSLFFVGAGLALLVQGHRLHKLNTNKIHDI